MQIFDCFKPFLQEKENLKLEEKMKVKERQNWFDQTFIVGSPAYKSVKINVKPVEDEVQVANDKFLKTPKKCEKSHKIGAAQQRKSDKVLKVPGSAEVPKSLKSSHPRPVVRCTPGVHRKALVSDLKRISRS
jgi:hypothetical protein